VPSALDPLIADIQAAVQGGDDARFHHYHADGQARVPRGDGRT
jgi:hypothetical protein